jgi:hypothetical protein
LAAPRDYGTKKEHCSEQSKHVSIFLKAMNKCYNRNTSFFNGIKKACSALRGADTSKQNEKPTLFKSG